VIGRPRLYSDEERAIRKRASAKLSRRRAWVKNHPGARQYGVMTGEEKKQKALDASRAHYAKNKDKCLDWHRKNYATNKAAILARNKAWAVANPDSIRQLSLEGTNRRNARLKGAEGSHTREEWMALVERCGHKCVCCGERKKLTRDHIIPILAGGSDYIANIQPLCRECNSSKGNRRVINYLLDEPLHVHYV